MTTYTPNNQSIANMVTHFQNDVNSYRNPPVPNQVTSNGTIVFGLSQNDLSQLLTIATNNPDHNVYFRFAAMNPVDIHGNGDQYLTDYVNNFNTNNPTNPITAWQAQNQMIMVACILIGINGTVSAYYNVGTICPPPSGVCGKITKF